MARVLLPVLGLMMFGLGTAPHAADWSALVRVLEKSVVTIERNDAGVSCTGFVINSRAKDKDDHDVDYVLTANHCDADKLWADQSVATVIAKNKEKDLLVLSIEDSDRPALKLAKDNPKVGDQVASYGYGYGLERPLFRLTTISAETYIPYDGIGGPLFMTDATFVGGQSGGAVVNEAGEVVMMVQMGTNSVGMGHPIGLGVASIDEVAVLLAELPPRLRNPSSAVVHGLSSTGRSHGPSRDRSRESKEVPPPFVRAPRAERRRWNPALASCYRVSYDVADNATNGTADEYGYCWVHESLQRVEVSHKKGLRLSAASGAGLSPQVWAALASAPLGIPVTTDHLQHNRDDRVGLPSGRP